MSDIEPKPLDISKATVNDGISLLAHNKWLAAAREAQLPPSGNWHNWLVCAGRGFGKTFLGAQWAWWESWTHRETYTHIIAPTWDSDVVGVCFEGPAGLLKCTPPEIIADYNKGDAILKLTNGSIIRGFSAERPARLRGPQCLVEDTLVLMADGSQYEIREVRAGDYVMTRAGARRVTWSGMTDPNAELWKILFVDGRAIVGTSDHPVWVDGSGFVPIINLKAGDRACATNASSGAASAGTPMTETITSEPTNPSGPREPDGYMWQNTKPRSGLFLKDIPSTTKTKINSITISKILSCLRDQITHAITRGVKRLSFLKSRLPERRHYGLQRLGETMFARSAATTSNLVLGERRHHFAPYRVKTNGGNQPLLEKIERAVTAEYNSEPPNQRRYFAPDNAIQKSMGGARKTDQSSRLGVSIVANSSTLRGPTLASVHGLAPSLTTLEIRSVEKLATSAPVYDLTVDGQHEFFANGVLVHNCHRIWADEMATWLYLEETWDMAMMGLRLGEDVKAVITTTPRPLPKVIDLLNLAKDRKSGVVVTRGTTYDNKANLSKVFFEKIVKDYEGTTLGRQEIYAEIIDPEEMGVIKRSWWKVWPRSKKFPPFNYIIMSLDTAYSEKDRDKKTGNVDPSACSIWGLFFNPEKKDQECIMLLDSWQDWLGFPELLERVKKEQDITYGETQQPMIKSMWGKPLIGLGGGRKPDLLIIEKKASGQSLIQSLAAEKIYAFGYNPGNESKIARLHSVAHIFNHGMIYVPESSKHSGQPMGFANDLISQVCTFSGEGSTKYDDFVDTTTQAIRYLTDRNLITITPPAKRDIDAEEAERAQKRVNPYKR